MPLSAWDPGWIFTQRNCGLSSRYKDIFSIVTTGSNGKLKSRKAFYLGTKYPIFDFCWIYSIHYLASINFLNEIFFIGFYPIIKINYFKSIGYIIFYFNLALLAQDLPYKMSKFHDRFTNNDSKFLWNFEYKEWR